MAELQCAYSVLEYKHQALQKNRQKRPGNGKDINARKSKTSKDSSAGAAKAECKFYCHVHGAQNSHSSAQCKVMENQPQNFTADMRKAADPHHPPGGSTAVRGKTGPVQATGFMVIHGHQPFSPTLPA